MSPVRNTTKQTSINGFLGLSNVSSWIKNKFIDETRHHSSKHWTKPINLHQNKQNISVTLWYFCKKQVQKYV
jgi:hypothetical protein